ncbi:MAG: hypothetical protein JW801_09365 [Bacteroidales bacterium]|nr:hypothetical protein [Bacteroidales bacterium]
MKHFCKGLSVSLFVLTLVLVSSCIKDPFIIEDPGNMTDYRDNNGISYQIRLTGDLEGSVWGGQDGLYTDDSDLSTAAVHAGQVSVGETKVVTVMIRPGLDNYYGSTANGVTSSDYGDWYGSYEFVSE